jgi:uncharacterized protein YndB with AHSA1/START domain
VSITISSVTVDIEAPQPFVWDVLVDYASYPEWNPYTVRVDAVLELGADVVLHLPHPDRPGELLVNKEVMRVIDAPRHLQYDTADNLPGIFAVRDQWVEHLDEGRSSYRTTDVFSGQWAQVAFDLQGQWVKDGFDAVAHALKARAEQLWAARRPTL